jgi:hypothetical protein
MFVETITTPRDEWDRWNERLRMLAEPPARLIASIAWQSDSGEVTSVNLWESPDAVADFFVERVHPLVEAEGEPVTSRRATASRSPSTCGEPGPPDRLHDHRRRVYG